MEIQRTTMREWCTCTCEEKYRSSRQPHRCRCHHHSPHEFRTQVHHQHRRRRRRRRLLRDESGNDHDNNNPVQTRYNRWAPPPSRCSVVREIITYPYLSLLVRLHLSPRRPSIVAAASLTGQNHFSICTANTII